MRGPLIAAAVVVGWLAWDTRRRLLPADVLALIDSEETDNAPDVWSAASALVDSFSGVPVTPDNVSAFLDALTVGEGTRGPDGYRTLVGGGTFSDFSDHPANLGWRGLPLSDAQCRGAGYGPGCVSTAAGRYQFTRPTWARLAAKLRLPDFSPGSQDAAAVELLRENGALGDIERGDIASAVAKVRRVWASLPGSGYGQREESLSAFLGNYSSAGGALA